MRIQNSLNSSSKNPRFGYKLPTHINIFPEGQFCETKKVIGDNALNYLKEQDLFRYHDLHKAIDDFDKERFNLQNLIDKQRPLMKEWGVEDKFNNFINRFKEPDKDGKRDFSQVNVDKIDVFFNLISSNYFKPQRYTEDLSPFFDKRGYMKGDVGGQSGISIYCGKDICIDARLDTNFYDNFYHLSISGIKRLKDTINNNITRYFEKECQKILDEGYSVQSSQNKVQTLSEMDAMVHRDFDKFF